MTTTDTDLRALAHLATRLRVEAGNPTWDEPGIRGVLTSLRNTPLPELTRRVIGHALDPDARTPGAIRRPFTPSASAVETSMRNPRHGEGCEVCGRFTHLCICTNDDGRRITPTTRRTPGKPPDPDVRDAMRAATAAAKQAARPPQTVGVQSSQEET